jgi:hypothetical protein
MEAAALLAGIDLRNATNESEEIALWNIASRRGAGTWVDELVRAIKSHVLVAEYLAVRDLASRKPKEIDPRTVSNADLLEPSACCISADALVKWCIERGAPIPSPLVKIEQQPKPRTNYPDELRAAIDAFDAVHGDASATAGHTPKQALQKWLERHTTLGKDARKRVATVANWQRQGGAPKTPSK